MTELPHTYKRPVEAIARAHCAVACKQRPSAFDEQWACFKDEFYLAWARTAINTLRELGFITADGLAAIHAEEDANGQPRSVLPRYAPPPEQETR